MFEFALSNLMPLCWFLEFIADSSLAAKLSVRCSPLRMARTIKGAQELCRDHILSKTLDCRRARKGGGKES